MADISQVKLPGDLTNKNIKALKLPYGECSTAADASIKVVNIKVDNGTTGSNMPFILEKGVVVLVRFTITNTAQVQNLSLNVNNTGVIAIKYRNNELPDSSILSRGKTCMFTYDGIYWQLTSDLENAYVNLASSFDPTTTYSLGDYCTYNGLLYIYTATTPSTGIWDSSKWDQTTVCEEFSRINYSNHTLYIE